LFLLNRPESTIALLGQSEDPDVRTALIDLLPRLVRFESLWSNNQRLGNDLARQALLLALDGYNHPAGIPPEEQQALVTQLAQGHYEPRGMLPAEQQRLAAVLVQLFLNDESVSVHSAAEWLLRRLGKGDEVMKLTNQLAKTAHSGWRVSSTKHT